MYIYLDFQSNIYITKIYGTMNIKKSILTPTDARISFTEMQPSVCVIMHYTLYAQLFLRLQLLLHKERNVSTIKQFPRLQRVLRKKKKLVKWVPWQPRCDSILLIHSH
jgi:hypothetical protein